MNEWFIGRENAAFVPRDFAWCWKRDGGEFSRSIYYQPDFDVSDEGVVRLRSVDFHYHHSGPAAPIAELHRAFKVRLGNELLCELADAPSAGRKRLELRSRHVSRKAQAEIAQLLDQRPRVFLPRGERPTPTLEMFTGTGKVACFCGSGVSYEAGLPTLADVHEIFGVDDQTRNCFSLGLEDPLPHRMDNGAAFFSAAFEAFHVKAAMAQPTAVHRRLARAQQTGDIVQLISDNVDYLFEKVGARPARVRTTFPKAHYVDLDPRTKVLLVIGVAADRRLVIEQARRRSIPIVCVNPEEAVSPAAQNLSYLRDADRWHRMRAGVFFQHYVDPRFAMLDPAPQTV